MSPQTLHCWGYKNVPCLAFLEIPGIQTWVFILGQQVVYSLTHLLTPAKCKFPKKVLTKWSSSLKWWLYLIKVSIAMSDTLGRCYGLSMKYLPFGNIFGFWLPTDELFKTGWTMSTLISLVNSFTDRFKIWVEFLNGRTLLLKDWVHFLQRMYLPSNDSLGLYLLRPLTSCAPWGIYSTMFPCFARLKPLSPLP